jgi:type VI secretion system protein ImpG
VHRIDEVYAHYAGGAHKLPVHPLYSAKTEGRLVAADITYTARRLTRRQTTREKRLGQVSVYTGTEVYISISDQSVVQDDHAVSELSVRALCSNRHLT